jgi:hypothetical protein
MIGTVRIFRILSDKILAQLLRGREPELKIGIGSAGHGWMCDRHGLGPEAPLSPKGGVVLVWVQQLVVSRCRMVPQGPSVTRLRWPFPKMDGLREGAVLPPVRIHMQPYSAELSGRRYLAVKPVLFVS